MDFSSLRKKLGSQWSMYGPEIAHKIASGLYEETQVFRFLKFSILAELGSILGPKIDFWSFKKKLGSQWSMYGPEIVHGTPLGVYKKT